jgi:ketosteroid isomerase-like protein
MPPQARRDTARAMSEENVEVVRRWWVAFNQDGAPPLELCDERIEIRNPASFPNRGPYRGHDGVHVWMADTWDTTDELHMEVDEIIDVGDGETVVSVQRALGTSRYTRLSTDDFPQPPWAAVWTVRSGKAVSAEGYMSRAEALEAAGLAN